MLYKDLFPQSDLTVFIIASTFKDHIFIQQIFLSFYYDPCTVLVSGDTYQWTKRREIPALVELYLLVQFSSVTQSCPTLCYPINHSTPGLPVHHQLWSSFKLTSTESDAIHPFHLLSFPSPPAPNPSQHQSLFQWVNSSHEVAKVLEFQL